MAEKETVLIIHGTFAAPVEGQLAWYEPGSAFCRELDERLASKGASGRCWAHLEECGNELRRKAGRSTTYFSWSGRNSWLDRTVAAQQLVAEIEFLGEKGWRWKIVAHSHGGNVVLEAFDFENFDRPGGLAGNTVLLGAPIFFYSTRLLSWLDEANPLTLGFARPFIHYRRRPIAARRAPIIRVIAAAVVSLVFWASVVMSSLKLSGLSVGQLFMQSPRWWVVRSGLVIALLALYWCIRFLARSFDFLGNVSALMDMATVYPPRLLFINSERDEAWRFLTSVLSAAAPWDKDQLPGMHKRHAVSPGSILQKLLARAREVDRERYPWDGRGAGRWWSGIALTIILLLPFAHGLHMLGFLPYLVSWSLIIGTIDFPAALFFALSVPWRMGEAALFILSNLGYQAAAWFARRKAWKTMQEIALGLSGSPHRLSDISVSMRPHPRWARGEYLFEGLTKTAEDAAVAPRSQIVDRELGRVKEQSDSEFWRIDRWRDWIGWMATDADLVHTIYYRHPDCVEQIATHLAHTKDELFALKGTVQCRGATAPGTGVSV